ncbi:unnamed protein product [Lampetra planeri]
MQRLAARAHGDIHEVTHGDMIASDRRGPVPMSSPTWATVTEGSAIRGARIYNEAMLSISVMVMIISFVVFTVLQYNKWKAKAARRRKSASFSTARSPGGSVHHGEHKGFTWSADSTLEGGIPGGDIVNLNITNHNNNNTKTTTIANTTNGSSHWASRGSVV